MVSSAGGVRGMPATAPYSAAKGALERWGESLAGEIAPFGLGVTILVTGTYDTDIITDAGTTDDRDFDGPYAVCTSTMNRRGRFAIEVSPGRRSGSPTAWSRRSTTAGAVPPPRRSGRTRRCCWRPTGCCRASGMHHMSRVVMGIPRQGSMRGGAYPLTTAQRAMVFTAKVLPQPVVARLTSLAMRLSPVKPAADESESND